MVFFFKIFLLKKSTSVYYQCIIASQFNVCYGDHLLYNGRMQYIKLFHFATATFCIAWLQTGALVLRCKN